MKTFFNVEDLGDLKAALAEAQEVKANRFGYQELGKNKTLLMIFFQSLSVQWDHRADPKEIPKKGML